MDLLNVIETCILSAADSLYSAWGWFGVAVLLTFENATGITPSEIILSLAGWMLISEQQLPPSMVLLGGLFAAMGSVFGASITYWVARLGGRPLVDKFTHWVRIDPAHINRDEELFQCWGTGLVLIGRVIPGIRTLINIPTGLARMPFTPILLITFIGSYVWCALLIGAGYILGNEWTLISKYLKLALPYLLIIGFIALAFQFWLKRRSMSKVYSPVRVKKSRELVKTYHSGWFL